MMFFETPISLIPETSPFKEIKEINDTSEIKNEKFSKIAENDTSTENIPEPDVKLIDDEDEENNSIEKLANEDKDASSDDSEEENDKNREREEEDEVEKEEEDEVEKEEDEVEEKTIEVQKVEKQLTESSDQNDVICIDDSDEKDDEKKIVEQMIQSHSIKELRSMCKEKGLLQGGCKHDLASRIVSDSKSVINIIS